MVVTKTVVLNQVENLLVLPGMMTSVEQGTKEVTVTTLEVVMTVVVGFPVTVVVEGPVPVALGARLAFHGTANAEATKVATSANENFMSRMLRLPLFVLGRKEEEEKGVASD